MQIEHNFLEKVRQVLIIEASDIAYPLVSVKRLRSFLTHDKRQWSVDIGKTGGLLSDGGFLYVHVTERDIN